MKDINTLTNEEKEKLVDIELIICKLQEFSNKANNNLFNYLFGKKMGDWQYHENLLAVNNKNILSYFKTLNKHDRMIIAYNILFNDKLYENC